MALRRIYNSSVFITAIVSFIVWTVLSKVEIPITMLIVPSDEALKIAISTMFFRLHLDNDKTACMCISPSLTLQLYLNIHDRAIIWCVNQRCHNCSIVAIISVT